MNISRQTAWQGLINDYQLKESEIIAGRCRARGIKPVFLKGVQLLNEVYPNINGREMSDIDIYVDRDKLQQFHSVLTELGYKEDRVKRWAASRHKADYFKTSEVGFQFHVDVHSQLLFEQSLPPLNFRQSTDKDLVYLDHPEQLFHLIVHMGYQHTFDHTKNWNDINAYLCQFLQVDGVRFWRLAKQNNLVHLCWAALKVVEREYQTKIELLDEVNPTRKSRLLLWLLNRSFFLRPKRGARYFLIKHLTKKSLMQSLRYDILWLVAKLTGAY